MDNHTNPTNEPNSPGGPQPPSSNPFERLISGIRKGADEAKRAADDAMPKVKSAAADAAYWTAYGVSFAVMFQWAVARHVASEWVKPGWADGTNAGKDAAEQWIQRMASRKSEAQAPSPLLPPPSPEAGSAAL